MRDAKSKALSVNANLYPVFVPETAAAGAKPIWCVDTESWPGFRAKLPQQALAFAEANGFEPAPGNFLLLAGGDGIGGALFACDAPSALAPDPFLPGKLAGLLPGGVWQFATPPA